MRIRSLFIVFLLTASAWAQTGKAPTGKTQSPEDRTARYLESVRSQPSLLLEFLRAMPKGGDLHMHLSGAIYAESYIQWAADDGVCLNRATMGFAPAPCDTDKALVPAKQILTDSGLYQQVINAQSMRFFNGPESAHDHFFNAFGKFGLVSNNHAGEMLAEVASRAAAQNEQYLEVLFSPDKGATGRFLKQAEIPWTDDFAAFRQALLDKGMGTVVAESRKNLDDGEVRMREVLHCGTPQADPGCGVTIRYQFQISRGGPREAVFASMVTAFELATADHRVVDLNPVQPEDAYVPMHDFDLQMRMLDYLHGVYPKVHLSLHAGELWHGVVPPEGLRHHIRTSVELGHANRIGHGVDVMFEDDAPGLLKEMAAKKVAVEINLTSNDQILGVRGDEHPLPIYLRYGVPVAISTDDEGVARSSITNEYWRAERTYPISYRELKNIVRNSLEYSFLEGESLWAGGNYAKRNVACAKDPVSKPSAKCSAFLDGSPRAKLQWKLESDFVAFESGRADSTQRRRDTETQRRNNYQKHLDECFQRNCRHPEI